jgi:hypothetical protein
VAEDGPPEVLTQRPLAAALESSERSEGVS